MTAALLTSDRLTLHNVPMVRDIITMGKLLAYMGATVTTHEFPASNYSFQAHTISDAVAPYELVKTMRASILTLGPTLARTGIARVSLPGGCAIGARPIDLHLTALQQMGAEIVTSHGYIEARAPQGGRLTGAHIVFEKITVTGTENILMAAVLAEGETILENSAREPEVSDLVVLLRKMGAKIEGEGSSTLRIQGVPSLHGAEHSVIPDRIEAGSFLIAGAITNGDVTVTQCEPLHLTALINKLRETGVSIERPVEQTDPGTLRVVGRRKLVASDITTEEYPGFPTDMQAQYMALATQAEGISTITETIFENRYLHASEMIRMGANIAIDGRTAVVRGPAQLSGTTVQASDLRASAGLVLAALVASGETTIERVYHIDRGYERIVEKLGALGANISRVHGLSS
jgi:UDP-N-acetylglucosamine 1-carboxyvinyltransferase